MFEGDLVYGKRTGKGTYTWVDGDVYEGDFIAGGRTGKGTSTWANGKSISGTWKNNDFVG